MNNTTNNSVPNTKLPPLTRLRIIYIILCYVSGNFAASVMKTSVHQEEADFITMLIGGGGVIAILSGLLAYYIRKDLNPAVRYFANRWIAGVSILLASGILAGLAIKLGGDTIETLETYKPSEFTKWLIFGGIAAILMSVTYLWNRGLYGMLHGFEDQWTLYDHLQIAMVNFLPICLIIGIMSPGFLFAPLSILFYIVLIWQVLIVFRRMRLYSVPEAEHEVDMSGWRRWAWMVFLLPVICAILILASQYIYGLLSLLSHYMLIFLFANLVNAETFMDYALYFAGVAAMPLAAWVLFKWPSKWIRTLNKKDNVDESVFGITRILMYGIAVISAFTTGLAVYIDHLNTHENTLYLDTWFAVIFLFAGMVQYLHTHSAKRFLQTLCCMALLTVGMWIIGFLLGLIIVIVLLVIAAFVIFLVVAHSHLNDKKAENSPDGMLSRISSDIFVDRKGRHFRVHTEIPEDDNVINPDTVSCTDMGY